MEKSPLASVIIPAYNEEEAIASVLRNTGKLSGSYDIIVVDDGSTDRTYEIARRFGVRVLRTGKNLGKSAALEKGFEAAKADIIVTIDADFTYPPDRIPDLIRPIQEDRADLVIGTRFFGIHPNIPFLNRIGNHFFAAMVSVLTLKRVTDASSGMRAFRKVLLRKICTNARGLEWEVAMTTRSLMSGARLVEIPIEYGKRKGRSKLNPLKEGIVFFFSILRNRFY